MAPDSSVNPHCPPGAYNYQEANFVFNANEEVYEESRAVFDSSVYTTRNRPTFNLAEAITGPIPILSPRLMGDIESTSTGRYIRIRIRFLHIDKTIWLWKRQYLRMANSRCRDEIDYVFEYAFRQ